MPESLSLSRLPGEKQRAASKVGRQPPSPPCWALAVLQGSPVSSGDHAGPRALDASEGPVTIFTSFSLCSFHSLSQALLFTPPRIRVPSRLLTHVTHEVRRGVYCDPLTGSKA